MLNTLLSPDIPIAEKKKQLSEDYHINTENKLEKELNLMCNLSDLVEERGIEKGANKKLQELISKKLKKGQSIEVIADALEESVETIQKLINEMAAKTS